MYMLKMCSSNSSDLTTSQLPSSGDTIDVGIEYSPLSLYSFGDTLGGFNYDLMRELNGGKQAKDVWESSLTKPSEKKCGKHPTQKPEVILEKIILASTDEGDLILDPFNGSGTTGIVANRLNRKYIGIEKEKEYLDLTIRRLKKDN